MSSPLFQLHFWLYFDLLNKQILEQTEGDTIDYALKLVTLGPQSSLKMISGVSAAKYIQYLRDQALAKIPQIKPYFQLDPALGGLEASMKMDVRDYNWRLIAREIEKFGIKM